MFNSFHTSFVNSLYLLEMYQQDVLRFNSQSWKPKALASSPIYLKLRHMKLIPDIYSYLVKAYSPLGTITFNLNEMDVLLESSEDIIQEHVAYMLKKIVKRGVTFEKRGMLRYY